MFKIQMTFKITELLFAGKVDIEKFTRLKQHFCYWPGHCG